MGLAPSGGSSVALQGHQTGGPDDDLQADWLGYMTDDFADMRVDDLPSTCIACIRKFSPPGIVSMWPAEDAWADIHTEEHDVVFAALVDNWDPGVDVTERFYLTGLRSVPILLDEFEYAVNVPASDAGGTSDADWQAAFEVDAGDESQYDLLHLALAELDEVSEAAFEEDLPEPSPVAFEQARRVLEAMYEKWPRRFMVYPMPGGYIAIDARGGFGNAVMVMCGSGGDARCIVTINDADSRAAYSSARKIPDAFVWQSLSELWTATEQ